MKTKVLLRLSYFGLMLFLGFACTKNQNSGSRELRLDNLYAKMDSMQTMLDTAKIGLADGFFPQVSSDNLLAALSELKIGISKAKAGQFVLQFEVDNYVIAADKAIKSFLNSQQITLTPGTPAELIVFGTDKKGRIEFGESSAYSAGQKWTVESWLKYEEGFNESAMGDFISTFEGRADGSIVGWTINFLGGNLRTTIGMGPQFGRVLEFGVPQPTNYGAWNYLVAVYDGTASTDQLKMYLNGELLWKKTNDVKDNGGVLQSYQPNNTDNRMWAFQRPSAPDCCMTGSMRKFRLWSVVKSADEVKTLMNSDVQGTEPGLTCAWDFTLMPADISNIPDKTGKHIAKIVGSHKWTKL